MGVGIHIVKDRDQWIPSIHSFDQRCWHEEPLHPDRNISVRSQPVAGQCYVSVTTYGRALAAQMKDTAFQKILDSVRDNLQSR